MPENSLDPEEMSAALDFASLISGSLALEAATWLLRATSLPSQPEFGRYVTVEQDPSWPGSGPPMMETLWLARPDWPRLAQHLEEFELDERERTLLQLAVSYAAGIPVALDQALGLETADARRVVEACLIAQGLQNVYAVKQVPVPVPTPVKAARAPVVARRGASEGVMAWHAATPGWTMTAGRLAREMSRLDPATEVVLIGDVAGNGGTRRVHTRVLRGTFFPAGPDSWHGHFCEEGRQCLHDDETWGLDLDTSAGQVSAVRIEPVN